MKIVIKNSTIVLAKAVYSATGKIIKVLSSDAPEIIFPTGVSGNVMGRNVVDLSSLVYHKILNDSGVEIEDASSYFNNFIPVVGGCTLQSNNVLRRIYYYDENKNFLGRTAQSAEYSREVPVKYNDTPVFYAKIQTASLSESSLATMIVTKDEDAVPTEFEAFKSNTNGTIYSPYSWVYADDLSEITIAGK